MTITEPMLNSAAIAILAVGSVVQMNYFLRRLHHVETIVRYTPPSSEETRATELMIAALKERHGE